MNEGDQALGTLTCKRCGYDLKDVCDALAPQGACPECDTPFTFKPLSVRATWTDQHQEGVIGHFILLFLIFPWIQLMGLVIVVLTAIDRGALETPLLVIGIGLLIALGGLLNISLALRLNRNLERRQQGLSHHLFWLVPTLAVLQGVVTASYFGACTACMAGGF
ncbi:MAG: hypothetical protein V3V20_07950 [Algisphaera sp.]